jgi:hypothetical protein
MLLNFKKQFKMIYSNKISFTGSGICQFSRISILIFTLLILNFFCSGCRQSKAGKPEIKGSGNNNQEPLWIADNPMVFIGDWDAMPIFRRRIGGNPVWQQDAYYNEHTEEAVKKYKEMGVTMMLLHFYKGFGLEAEKEHIEEAKKLASICKQNGLRVGVYVGSTIGYETFLLEKPEAAEWFVPDYMGKPVLYGDQTFRKRVYFMHPGYIDYMKKVIRIAVQDLKADLIHFDNTSMQAEPAIFHHSLAIKHFRSYLSHKYTPEELVKRFGFSDIRYVEPPLFEENPGKIDDPLFQEWTDFRCYQLAEYYGIMDNYIDSLNPEVAVCNNPHTGLSGINTMWKQGIDYPGLLSHTNIIWTEEGNSPAYTGDGILISRIRTYKMAKTLNNRIFTYTTDSKLEMAESMAYNRQGLGMVGGLREMEGNQVAQGFELPADQKNYIKFFHKNFQFYQNISSLADVAVLHSHASMAFNNDRPYQSTYLYEQVLIQEKIPFDIIFDEQLKNLSKYKVLILADQECLNNDKIDLIREFVEQGGGVVATEFTSLYTEWRSRMSDFGMQRMLQISPPAWNGRNSSESILNIAVKRNEFGKGRVVYIPEVRPSAPKPTGENMSARYWKLPVNSEELIDAVKWAAGKDLSIKVTAPEKVTVELTMSENSDNMMIHLINFGGLSGKSLKNIHIDVCVPEGTKVRETELLSPDFSEKLLLDYKVNTDRVTFRIPVLTIYDLVVVHLDKIL